MSTHQQLLYHIVFSTKHRQPWLTDGFREDLFGYMASIAARLDGFALRIGGYFDHTHILARISAKLAVSEFVGKLKANSSKHVNDTSGICGIDPIDLETRSAPRMCRPFGPESAPGRRPPRDHPPPAEGLVRNSYGGSRRTSYRPAVVVTLRVMTS